MRKQSVVKKALFTPLFKMRVVKAKKGKGSWVRQPKHRYEDQMINEIHGDVLNTVDSIIIHCVNCQGVMGGGIAAQIKRRYPEAYDVYKETYENGLLVLGSVSYAYFPG